MAEKQRVMIVDDDANIAELISLYLAKECYETKIVYDGEELETKTEHIRNIDVIIHKIQRDKTHIGYYAELEYGNVFYYISGDMEEQDFLSLIDNMEFW